MEDTEYDISTRKVLVAAQRAITRNLRCQIPYMSMALVDDAIKASLAPLRQRIEDAKPQILASKARTSFLSLPPEIRNAIYDLYFAPDESGDYRFNFDESAYTNDQRGCYRSTDGAALLLNFPEAPVSTFPALLQISRQVRAEAMPVFLSHLTVSVASDRLEAGDKHDAVLDAKAWLQGLGPKSAKLIKKFVLQAVTANGGGVPSKEVLWERFGLKGLGVKVEDVEFSETVGMFLRAPVDED